MPSELTAAMRAACGVALLLGGTFASPDVPPHGGHRRFSNEHARKLHRLTHSRRDGNGHNSLEPPSMRDALDTARNNSHSVDRKSLSHSCI